MTERRRPPLRPMQGFPPTVRLIGIGWYVALTIVLGVAGGVLLDDAVDTDPIFTLVGLVLGLVMAFWGGYIQLKETLEAISARSREQSK